MVSELFFYVSLSMKRRQSRKNCRVCLIGASPQAPLKGCRPLKSPFFEIFLSKNLCHKCKKQQGFKGRQSLNGVWGEDPTLRMRISYLVVCGADSSCYVSRFFCYSL